VVHRSQTDVDADDEEELYVVGRDASAGSPVCPRTCMTARPRRPVNVWAPSASRRENDLVPLTVF
jgi:hypothetical protein